MSTRAVLRSLALVPILALAACQTVQPIAEPLAIRQFDPRIAAFYSEMPDGDFVIPAINPEIIAERNIRQIVPFQTNEPVGTVVVDPYGHHLYLVMEGGQAMRYGVGVGRAGFAFAGTATVARKAAWPRWTPTQNMLRREPERYGEFAGGVQGGLSNPLGARALYLYRNGRDTLYRIHGTNEPHTIGNSVSAGCIRMFNQDVVDLEQRVPNGSRVVVLSEAYEPASLEIASFGQSPAQEPIEIF